MKLDTLEIGKDAVVASVTSDDQALRQHILDMGLTPGTEVTMMKYAPMGDPLEIRLRGYELTLRKDDAAFKKVVSGEIHRLITQGEIQPIYRKWFESPIPPKQANLKMPMSYLLRDSFKSPTDWLPN